MYEYDVSMCFVYMMVHEPVWVHTCMQISLFVEITEGYQDPILSLSTYSFETGSLTDGNTKLAVSNHSTLLCLCLTQCWGYEHYQNLLLIIYLLSSPCLNNKHFFYYKNYSLFIFFLCICVWTYIKVHQLLASVHRGQKKHQIPWN